MLFTAGLQDADLLVQAIFVLLASRLPTASRNILYRFSLSWSRRLTPVPDDGSAGFFEREQGKKNSLVANALCRMRKKESNEG